jgi:hypothetical protein
MKSNNLVQSKFNIPNVIKENLLKEVDPLETLKTVVNGYTDYLKFAEQEKTKRREIKANERVKLDEIRAKRGIIMSYLEKSFDERKDNFGKLFKLLDAAFEKDNSEAMGNILNSIVDLATSSPFKDLASISSVRELKEIEF